MLESMGRKNILVNLTASKEHIKNAPKKIKKYVTKQIKNIKQTRTLSPINLRGKNKNNIDEIKYAEAPLHGVLKGSNLPQVGLERNEYRIRVIEKPEWPPLMEAIAIPNEMEKSFYSLLKNNKVDERDVDLIKEIISEMKKTKSSDDIVIKLYDFYELFLDKEYVTNKFIVNYLEEPMGIAKDTQCTNLESFPPLPSQATITTPEPIDVADELYKELTKTISKMSRLKDVPDELFIHFKDNILKLKENEKPEIFIKKLNSLFEYGFDILSQATLGRIESNLADYIKIDTEIVKPIHIFDDIKMKPKSLRERLLNAIEWKLFFFIKKAKEVYLEMKKFFRF
ncbi:MULTISPECIES: hypothetical protein [Providencia]|uniref:hypothetical protein n=1 Tax=Providencia TaxID=586 RepID=UPI001ADB3680|nr:MULTISPECIES: hypothetical protein [Providencia]MBO8256310.1 hypothetical protein [Providencia rettgeri]MBO8258972.1 hypothetical protein [Providencia rettgeri]MCG9943817.1 hypothetical protein [Providencia rettgeri]MDE4734125.1 hypothetical protein [Providencia rettgeri]